MHLIKIDDTEIANVVSYTLKENSKCDGIIELTLELVFVEEDCSLEIN